MPWAAPPLFSQATLGGVPLEDYLNDPVKLEAQHLLAFWRKTMQDIWHKPALTVKSGVYAGAHKALGGARKGVQALRFARPPGYPNQFELTAGAQFSLEVAHTAFISLPCRRQVVTLDDYYVVLADGTEVGIKNGLPLVDSPWTHNVSGDILEMLETSRLCARCCTSTGRSSARTLTDLTKRCRPCASCRGTITALTW